MAAAEMTYYSDLEGPGPTGRAVYHAVADCPAGRRLPEELRTSGPGDGRELCPACSARLNPIRNNCPPSDIVPLRLGPDSSRCSSRSAEESPYGAMGNGPRMRATRQRAAACYLAVEQAMTRHVSGEELHHASDAQTRHPGT